MNLKLENYLQILQSSFDSLGQHFLKILTHSRCNDLLYTHQLQDRRDAIKEKKFNNCDLKMNYVCTTDSESSPTRLLATAKIFGE